VNDQAAHQINQEEVMAAPARNVFIFVFVLICYLYSNIAISVAEQSPETIQALQTMAESGNVDAQFNLGVSYYQGDGVLRDVHKAEKWFRKAAEQGDAGAQHNLGAMYYEGDGVPQNATEAEKWFRLAAEQGLANHQYVLAIIYLYGEIIPQNLSKAERWLRKAANQNHVKAQYYLGYMYYNGQGLPPNGSEAEKWFQKAAEQNFENAQLMLGIMYFEGDGVQQDYAKSYAWLNMAAKHGDSATLKFCEAMPALMTKQQLVKAEKLAASLSEIIENSSAFPQNSDLSNIKGIGTGFFVSADGYILTCYHVIENSDIVIVKAGMRTHTAKIVKLDPYNDMALLKIPGYFPTLGFSDSPSAALGDTVFTMGFPNPFMQGFAPKFTKGEINSLTGVQDDPRLYQISVPVHPGNSGGPLLNMQGQVVGFVVAILDAETAFNTTGVMPQNVNYAVKSEYAKNFLKTVPEISLNKIMSPGKKSLTFKDVVAQLEACTVMVMTY
jgi:TPR repeat protein